MTRRLLSLLWLLPCLSQAISAMADTRDPITVIDEDFAAFAEGTPDAPSPTTLLNDFGYFLDPSRLKPYDASCTRAWGGHNLYSAGGCLAVRSGGFLNTPAGDMSGNLTISFRARLAKGQQVSDPKLDVILLSRKVLVDYRRWTVALTEDWQTFTLEATNGWFSETGIQFFTMTSMDYLVDDVRVTRVQTSIVPPEAHEAEETREDGFTAVWDSTATADDYLLSVYTKHDNPHALEVAQGFDDIRAGDDGSLASQPNLPEGWGFTWNGPADGRIATDGHSGGQSVRLSQANDCVETPVYNNSLSAFKLWVKAEGESRLGGTALLYVREENGWFPWQYIGMEALRNLGQWTQIDLTSQLSAFDHVLGVRVEYQPAKGDAGALLVDDMAYTVPGEPILTYALHDQLVGGRASTRYTVTGLDPDADYFYHVKARNSEFTSAPSDEIEVFYVSQPVALPATDVTADGYTAHWNCGGKADYFRLDQLQETPLTEDVDSFVVLYEDFSRVKAAKGATFDQPDYGPQTSVYTSIDDLTLVGGWKASSWQYIDGWLGGAQKMEDGAIAGALTTPTIDLSHNDGICSVSVRAYGYGGDWLIIQGVSPAARAFIEFPANGGIVETTVDIPLCSNRENLTFYSNNYYPFLIDYIKITQKLKEGETASVITKSVVTANATARAATITGAGFSETAATRYKVTAFRYFHGDKNDVWASVPSELVTVKEAATGIGQPVETRPSGLCAVPGGIAVGPVKGVLNVQVYTAAGSLVKRQLCKDTTTFIPLPPGAYIVRAAGRAEKVVAK